MVKSYSNTLCKAFGALVASVSFGIFAYGNLNKKEGPSADCYATYDSNDALPVDVMSTGSYDEWINVSHRFQLLFLLGFWLNIIKLCIFVPIELYYIRQYRRMADLFLTADDRDKLDPVPRMFRNLESIVGIIELVWIVLVFVWRIGHEGRVCSGEYLSQQNVAGVPPFETFVDKASGQILIVVVQILLAMIILVPIIGCLLLIQWLIQTNTRPKFGKGLDDDVLNKV